MIKTKLFTIAILASLAAGIGGASAQSTGTASEAARLQSLAPMMSNGRPMLCWNEKRCRRLPSGRIAYCRYVKTCR
jgi:hypothetical protein